MNRTLLSNATLFASTLASLILLAFMVLDPATLLFESSRSLDLVTAGLVGFVTARVGFSGLFERPENNARGLSHEVQELRKEIYALEKRLGV